MLIVGVNKDTVKGLIDVVKGDRAAITKNKIYRSSTQGFSDKVNQLAFLNLDRAMDIIIQITTWANNLQKAAGAAPGADQAIQQNVLPLLESLRVLKSVAVEAVNRKNGIEETVYVNVEDIS